MNSAMDFSPSAKKKPCSRRNFFCCNDFNKLIWDFEAYNSTKGYRLTILSILLVFLVSGCSRIRRLTSNQALVTKITIKGADDEFAEAAVNYVDKDQQPNNWLNLQLYYKFGKKGKN